MNHGQGDHAQQGQQAAHQRVQEEGDRGPFSLRAAIQPHQEEERNQGELKEHIKQNHVQRREQAQQAGLKHQHQGVELGSSLLDGLPGRADSGDHEHRGEQEQ